MRPCGRQRHEIARRSAGESPAASSRTQAPPTTSYPERRASRTPSRRARGRSSGSRGRSPPGARHLRGGRRRHLAAHLAAAAAPGCPLEGTGSRSARFRSRPWPDLGLRRRTRPRLDRRTIFWLWTPRLQLHRKVTIRPLLPGAPLASFVLVSPVATSPLWIGTQDRPERQGLRPVWRRPRALRLHPHRHHHLDDDLRRLLARGLALGTTSAPAARQTPSAGPRREQHGPVYDVRLELSKRPCRDLHARRALGVCPAQRAAATPPSGRGCVQRASPRPLRRKASGCGRAVFRPRLRKG